MDTIPFLLPRVAEDLKENWQTAKHSSLADIANTKTCASLAEKVYNAACFRLKNNFS